MSTEIPRFDHDVARAAQAVGRAAFSPWRMLAYLVLGVVAVIYIIPFYWMIASAIKPQSEMFQFPPTLIPQTVTFDNFARVFEVIPLAQAYWNTFYTTLRGPDRRQRSARAVLARAGAKHQAGHRHHYHLRLPGGLEQLPVAADHSQLAPEDADRAGALGADRGV